MPTIWSVPPARIIQLLAVPALALVLAACSPTEYDAGHSPPAPAAATVVATEAAHPPAPPAGPAESDVDPDADQAPPAPDPSPAPTTTPNGEEDRMHQVSVNQSSTQTFISSSSGNQAGTSIRSISTTSDGAKVRVKTRTTPDASCSIRYRAPDGTVQDVQRPADRHAEDDGLVTWEWEIDTRGRGPGTATVEVTCDGATVTTSVPVS